MLVEQQRRRFRKKYGNACQGSLPLVSSFQRYSSVTVRADRLIASNVLSGNIWMQIWNEIFIAQLTAHTRPDSSVIDNDDVGYDTTTIRVNSQAQGPFGVCYLASLSVLFIALNFICRRFCCSLGEKRVSGGRTRAFLSGSSHHFSGFEKRRVFNVGSLLSSFQVALECYVCAASVQIPCLCEHLLPLIVII